MTPVEPSTWPRILWVAAQPPIPPFSGATLKSLCGLQALASVTEVELVTFSEANERTTVQGALDAFWKDKLIGWHLIDYGPRASWLAALFSGRFQVGMRVERSRLPGLLAELGRDCLDRLLVLDHIMLAPLAVTYGHNAILSPHDCMSEMFLSHFRLLPVGVGALKKNVQFLIARRYERAFYHLGLLVHVVTHRDRVWLEEINPRARYHVTPYADLGGPSFPEAGPSAWDVIVWGDLRVASIVGGTIRFLNAISQDKRWLRNHRVLLVGRVPRAQAGQIVGEGLLRSVEYAPYLEDEHNQVRNVKVIVVPDLGGAGTKGRVLSLLTSGQCLACLYPQMEGLELACDRGAINAVTMETLVAKVKMVLQTNQYLHIGKMGQVIFQQEYNLGVTQRRWLEMIQRALVIRAWRRA